MILNVLISIIPVVFCYFQNADDFNRLKRGLSREGFYNKDKDSEISSDDTKMDVNSDQSNPGRDLVKSFFNRNNPTQNLQDTSGFSNDLEGSKENNNKGEDESNYLQLLKKKMKEKGALSDFDLLEQSTSRANLSTESEKTPNPDIEKKEEKRNTKKESSSKKKREPEEEEKSEAKKVKKRAAEDEDRDENRIKQNEKSTLNTEETKKKKRAAEEEKEDIDLDDLKSKFNKLIDKLKMIQRKND